MSDSRLSDEELEEAFDYARGSLRLTAALSELRERRAADLSAEEVDQLTLGMAVIREVRETVTDNEFRARLHIVESTLMRVAENAYRQTPLYQAALAARKP